MNSSINASKIIIDNEDNKMSGYSGCVEFRHAGLPVSSWRILILASSAPISHVLRRQEFMEFSFAGASANA